MHATTDPADNPTDNTMNTLYHAALGPVNRDYYLPIFAHFDAMGRTSTRWNWAASLCTINWMVFRQAWSAALIYVAIAEGLALLVFALGRQFLHWPQGVEWGVVASFALLAFAAPGLYGNALLHADIRRRIARALSASRTVPEACAMLAKRASSTQRLRGLVGINLVLAALVMVAYLALPTAGSPNSLSDTDRSMEQSVTVAQAASAAASAASMASATQPPATAAPEAPAAAPSAASAPAVADAAANEQANTPAQSANATPPAAAPATPTPPVKPASKAKADPPARQPAITSERKPRQPAATTPPPAARTTLPAAASEGASAALPTVGQAPGYYINVGLFANEANARKAQARLLNEGLPAFRQTLDNAKSRRIRVRVGPYASRAQANAAAETIRAMALEAVVFKQ